MWFPCSLPSLLSQSLFQSSPRFPDSSYSRAEYRVGDVGRGQVRSAGYMCSSGHSCSRSTGRGSPGLGRSTRLDGSPGFRAPHCGALWFRSVPDSPVSQIGKNHRDRATDGRGSGWVGGRGGRATCGGTCTDAGHRTPQPDLQFVITLDKIVVTWAGEYVCTHNYVCRGREGVEE